MKEKNYLYLTIFTTIISYIPMTLFILTGDYQFNAIINALTSNYLIVFLLCDLLLSCLVFWYFIYTEVKKTNIPYWWIALLSNFLVGLCTAIPLFLYFRAKALNNLEK